jgi:hypothetical protein
VNGYDEGMRAGWLLLLSVAFSTACSGRTPVLPTTAGDDTVVAKGTVHRWTFDRRPPTPGTGEVATPRERIFEGVLGHWRIARDDDAPSPPGVYRQDARYAPNDAPRVVVSNLFFRDAWLAVRCRPDAGTEGQGCGLVFDARGSDDYFVVRADALDAVVRLVHVRGGEEREVASSPALVTPHVWHALRVHARAERVTVEWDGDLVLDAVDWTLAGGRIGLATTADAVTSFDDLEAIAE